MGQWGKKRGEVPVWTPQEEAELWAAVIIMILQSRQSKAIQDRLFPIIREVELTNADHDAISERLAQAGFERSADAVRYES